MIKNNTREEQAELYTKSNTNNNTLLESFTFKFSQPQLQYIKIENRIDKEG